MADPGWRGPKTGAGGKGRGPGGATNVGAIKAGRRKAAEARMVAAFKRAFDPIGGTADVFDAMIGNLSPPRKGQKYGVPPKKGGNR